MNLEEKWGKKYTVVLETSHSTSNKPSPSRKLIYTINALEDFHRQVRKVTKAKGAFSNDMALLKLVCLASKNIQKKWTTP